MALYCCPEGLFVSIFEEGLSNNKGDNGRTDIIKNNRKRVITEPFKNTFSSLSLRCLYITCDAK